MRIRSAHPRCVAAGVALVMIAGACTTVRRRPISGREIDRSEVEKIVPNETKKEAVREAFGEPAKIERGPGVTEWRYGYSGYVDRKTEAVVYARETSEKESKSLRVTIKDDVVIGVCLTNTLDPGENFAAPATACRSLPGVFVLLVPEPDGSVGKIELRQGSKSRLQEEARQATGFDPQRPPIELTEEEIKGAFEDALEAMPEDPARFILYFQNDSTKLTRDSQKLLDEVVSETKRRPVPEITVVGHTDTRGSARYNQGLGLSRARIVREAVLKVGADAKLVTVTSLGESAPLVKTKDNVSEPKNRRVEVIVQ